MRTHHARLYRVAYRLTGSSSDAEDLLQDTFLEAWRSLGSLREPAKAAAWMYGILRYRHFRRLRRKARSRVVTVPDEVLASGYADPGPDVLARLSDRELLERALAAVATPQREALVLLFVEGLDSFEAAERMGVSRGTVLSRVHRARRTLRTLMRDDVRGDAEGLR